jgi:hypothetical protein
VHIGKHRNVACALADERALWHGSNLTRRRGLCHPFVLARKDAALDQASVTPRGRRLSPRAIASGKQVDAECLQ